MKNSTRPLPPLGALGQPFNSQTRSHRRYPIGWGLINMKNSRPLPLGSSYSTLDYTIAPPLQLPVCTVDGRSAGRQACAEILTSWLLAGKTTVSARRTVPAKLSHATGATDYTPPVIGSWRPQSEWHRTRKDHRPSRKNHRPTTVHAHAHAMRRRMAILAA